MSEPTPKPRSGEFTSATELRIAVSSSDSRRWAWGWALAVVLAAGGTLYAARAAVAPALDRWLPRPPRASPEVAAPAVAPTPEPEPAVEEAGEPEWTYVAIEAALVSLPEDTEGLIAEGRDELAQFAGLDADDETRALVVQNRWRMWGRIWQNRVAQVGRRLPPIEQCEPHAALEPTCRAVHLSLTLLERVPSAGRVDEAKKLFEEASTILVELRTPPEEDDPSATIQKQNRPSGD